MRTITDEEQKFLEHDLLDIKEWIDKAIEGKINNCSKRAALAYKEEALQQGLKTIPIDSKDCALALFNSKGYKNRQAREQ